MIRLYPCNVGFIILGCLIAYPCTGAEFRISSQSEAMSEQIRQQPSLQKIIKYGDEEYKANIKAAGILLNKGNTENASFYIEEAAKLANTPESKAKADLIRADIINRSIRLKKTTDNLKQQQSAIDLYKASLPKIKGDLKLQGYNNYGTLLLRQKKPDLALQALLTIKKDYDKSTNSREKSRYFYNLARAYEKQNQPAKALIHFLDSAIASPQLAPASRAVLRLYPSVKATPAILNKTVTWLNAIVSEGDLTLAEQAIKHSFSNEALVKLANAEKLVIPLIQYFINSETRPQEYKSQWSKLLSFPASSVNKLAVSADEVNFVFTTSFPVSFRSSENSGRIKTLQKMLGQEELKQTLPAFIKTVGDGYFRQKQFEKALQRYALVIDLDKTNTEAALSAATILFDNAGTMPGADKMTQQLIGALFRGKGTAYLGEDWPNILKFHMALGAIYKQKKQWGSEFDPYGAIFQFSHAVKAHEKLNASQPKRQERIAGVKYALAESYFNAGQKRDAADYYVDAAMSAAQEKDRQLAKKILDEINTINLSLTDRHVSDLNKVKQYTMQ